MSYHGNTYINGQFIALLGLDHLRSVLNAGELQGAHVLTVLFLERHDVKTIGLRGKAAKQTSPFKGGRYKSIECICPNKNEKIKS